MKGCDCGKAGGSEDGAADGVGGGLGCGRADGRKVTVAIGSRKVIPAMCPASHAIKTATMTIAMYLMTL